MRFGLVLVCAACLSSCPANQRVASLMAESEKKLQSFQEDVKAAPCAKAYIHFMIPVPGKEDAEFPVPEEQLAELKEILSYLRPVPPAMGEEDSSTASFLAFADISFSDAQGNVSRFSGRNISVICPESIMSESKAKKLSTGRARGFYGPSWYLPDAQFARFESLPIVKQMREIVDKRLDEKK